MWFPPKTGRSVAQKPPHVNEVDYLENKKTPYGVSFYVRCKNVTKMGHRLHVLIPNHDGSISIDTSVNVDKYSSSFEEDVLQKGGDPSTASATDALLRLYPDYWSYLRPLKRSLRALPTFVV